MRLRGGAACDRRGGGLRMQPPAILCAGSKKMTGQGFTEYLNEQRLNAAADALRSGSDTVLAIAEQCGFENLSYFNRLFKKRYEMTPREYRGRNKKTSPAGKVARRAG